MGDAAVFRVTAAARCCVVCGESIAHRRVVAKTCSGKCRTALRRARLRVSLELIADRGFNPQKSCDNCSHAIVEATELDAPYTRCIWLDARRLAEQLERWVPDEVERLAKLNGSGGTFRRWRSGKTERVRYDTADKVLVKLGRHLSEIPPELWLDPETGSTL